MQEMPDPMQDKCSEHDESYHKQDRHDPMQGKSQDERKDKEQMPDIDIKQHKALPKINELVISGKLTPVFNEQRLKEDRSCAEKESPGSLEGKLFLSMVF